MIFNKNYGTALVFIVAACLTLNAEAAKIPDKNEVQKAVVNWLSTLKEKPYTVTVQAVHGIKSLPTYDRLFEIFEGPVHIGIGFKTAPTPTSTVEDLQKSLAYISLDQLPVPGIKAQAWQTKLQTPVSSFTQGVKIESWSKGILRLRVKTNFFAIYGGVGA